MFFSSAIKIISGYHKLITQWDRSSTCLIGKTVIVTGANSGIGFYTAQDFAKRGARVILACRDSHRAEEARKKIINATDNDNVHVNLIDFSSLQSVRDFSRRINTEEQRLDILVNNAGVVLLEDETTEDGLSLLTQINFFGPFLLTHLLLDLLKKSKPSRIVNVSSFYAEFAKLDIHNLNHFSTVVTSKVGITNYSYTKLCNILFTNELARRLIGTGVSVNSLNPGLVVTNILRNVHKTYLDLYSYFHFLLRTTEEGAQTSIYVAVSKDLKNVTGKYFDNCHISPMPAQAQDRKLALKVWELSESCVGLNEDEKVV